MAKQIYLDLAPEQWWPETPGSRLRIQVVGMEPDVDQDEGPSGWVLVSGWRDVPGQPQRRWARVLVRARSLPPAAKTLVDVDG